MPSTLVVWTHGACSRHLSLLLLTPALAYTPAGRGPRGPPEQRALHAATRHDRSSPPPSLVSATATPWLSRCHWSLQEQAGVDVSWREAAQNYGTSGTAPVDAASRPRPRTAC